jgi:hypothetical protein
MTDIWKCSHSPRNHVGVADESTLEEAAMHCVSSSNYIARHSVANPKAARWTAVRVHQAAGLGGTDPTNGENNHSLLSTIGI